MTFKVNNINFVNLLLFFLVFLVSSVYAAGDLDSSFNGSAFGKNNGAITTIIEQSDGKFLVGGFFMETNGKASSGIVRINQDGSFDPSFDPPVFYNGFGIGGFIRAIALQTDGKILVGGELFGVNGVYRSGVYRLNSDGSIDSSFTTVPQAVNSVVQDIEVLPNGKILLGGDISMPGISQGGGVVRLNSDGTFDGDISNLSQVQDIELLSNGQFYVGDQLVRRYNADLTLDSSFTSLHANGFFYKLQILPNGQILAAGTFPSINGFLQGGISKFNSDGSLDLTFNLNNSGANSHINSFSIRDDGKILIGGLFTSYNGQSNNKVALLNSDGTLDPSFQNTASLSNVGIYAVLASASGGMIVGAGSNPLGTIANSNTLLKLNENGSVDTSFDSKITRYGRVEQIEQQADGKIYVAGEFVFVNGFESRSIARLNADGTPDTSFVSYFNNSSFITRVTSFAVRPDGSILVGADGIISAQRGLYHLNSDGSLVGHLDTSVDVSDIAVQPDGKILYVGNFGNTTRLRRRNVDGSFDFTFDPPIPNEKSDSLALQSDGKIIISGSFTQVGGINRGRVARFNSDGTLDNSFNPPGGANDRVYVVELQSDGKILLGGDFTSLNGGINQKRIGRLNSDGTIDGAFIQTVDSTVYAIKAQKDGKVLIGGLLTDVGGSQKSGMARLNSSGSIDESFTANAPMGVFAIDIQTDNKILIGGEFIEVNGNSGVRVARLLNSIVTSSAKFDFDGDGRADIGVFRPSNNVWYQLLGVNYNYSESVFGSSGDVIAPGDYDGDGKADLGIFRPSTGDWWYQSSVTNSQVQNHWGQSGDVPRPADFDGDGKDDFVVYRPSNNVWYQMGTTGVVNIKQFGISGDKAVVGDFDGDGKGDIAIYRPSTGVWWYQSSIDGQNKATRFGISTDIPSPADYDGDGKTDLAVFRPSNGVWYILNSSNNSVTIIQFGLNEDKPIAADYDGDGKADIAVYRPSNGISYLLRSTSGFTAVQFGNSTDVPIQNAFIP